MKKKIYIIIVLICVISFIKTFLVFINDKSIYEEINDEKIGKVVYIKREDKKIVFDLKTKYGKYKVYYNNNFNYELGDKVSVKGIYFTPSNNTVFNLYNYRKYLLSKNIMMECKNANIHLIKKNNNIFYSIKNKIIKRISNYKSYDYLNTFILGDTSYINKTTKDNFSSLGISHLFSISGMHVSFLIMLLIKLLKKIKYKYIIIYIFILFFLFITNFQIGILRCLLFLIVDKLNNWFKLNIKPFCLIILVAFILLLFNPYFIYNVGFLFSIIITFFILLSKDIINKKGYFKSAFYMSLICFLASIPILINSFFKINLLTPLFNLIFIPIVSFVIFPFSLLTFIFPFLDDSFVFIIFLFENLCILFNKLDLFTFSIAKVNIFIIFIFYMFLYLSLKFNYKYIILFFLLLIMNINTRFLNFNTKLVFLDVDQGDSSTVIFPKGKAVLIDTGGIFYNDYSIVRSKIIPYFNSFGIKKIEYLILTHGDYDHIGEAINLVENFKVEKVIFNCGEFNELEQELIEVLDKKKIPYYSCIKELNIDDNKLYFLNNKIYDNENDNSSVIYTKINNHKFLFMGDAGVEVEEDLIEKYNLKDIDVLKVGHHGSKTSSGKSFIDEIEPRYSIISIGKNNRYGHPNKEVLENLEDSKIYRTDQDGSIMFKIKNNKLRIETCSP